MKRILAIVIAAAFAFLFPSAADQDTLQGYTAASSAAEQQWEAKFRALPSAEIDRENDRRLSAQPHHVGSARDKENAEWILSQFQSWGWDAHIENFDVLMPTPKTRLLEMIEPTKFTARLQEPALATDPTSNQQSEQLPTYNAYSIDGDVTAPLVYVNFGVPEDYDELARLGVSVKGAIVIARYGGSWRGVKPKVAAEHGAVGCIIYSDPHEDGYFAGDVFPKGPMRPPEGVQRGSVMDFASYSPGDPLTPGVGATKDAKRLTLKNDIAITKIPTLPISYSDAQPLLAALTGPMAPPTWRGSLAIPYHVGAGPTRVHLVVKSNWDTKTLYDVIAKLSGSPDADEWVIRGNHHDAWVNGAEDPVSGQAAMLEEARSLGELWKQGWRPKRTIIYCAWDGEEEGLLGSTEWAETHEKELEQHAVAYLNSDSNGRGYLGMDGSSSLEHFINGVSRDIQDPESHVSAWQRDEDRRIAQAKSDDDRKEIRSRSDIRLGSLGSGSDYSAFLDHLGIASLNIEYGGEDQGGIYHSIYDDYYWYTHFSDTDFTYGRALAQTAGTAVMRLADADLLPFEFTDLADTIRGYTKEVKKLADDSRDEAIERDKELDDGVYAAINDPRHPLNPPPREAVPPHLDFAPLDNAVDALSRSAQRFHAALAKAWPSGVPPATLQDLNQKLIESERRLTTSEGLLRRPWYRNMIDAPGVYSGYGAKTLPGVREAIEQEHWDEANSEISRVSKVLESESALIDSASADLEPLAK
ncbi:MAG TPA: transferrin receptor-like dimerization domain-containing protein [Candidatus Acidoferrales bacterium]|nr:transferrin receptor-like dimerization domain-containing protein [Candidatus Acidoferrales bacterium]